MELLFFVLLTCIVLLIYLLFKSFNKSIFITILCSLLILYIIINPNICINSAINGSKLFFTAVFPSLFPFVVIINIIIAFGGITFYSKTLGKLLCKPLKLPKECSFVLIVSVFCGYPLGARYTCDLYEKKIIDFDTCERLLNIASNASPLFVIGAVGTSMLGNTYLGYILLLSNFLSCIIMGLLSSLKHLINKNPNKTLNEKKYIATSPQSICPNIGIVLKNSIEDALKTAFSIGGFIIIFSVITAIIKDNALFNIVLKNTSLFFNVPKEFLEGCSLGLLEMTNGCYLISSISMSLCLKLSIISFMISFSGLSIISQVHSFSYKHNISIKKYILRKFTQGCIASMLSLSIYKLSLFNVTQNTFHTQYTPTNDTFFLIIFFIITLPLIGTALKKLFHIS